MLSDALAPTILAALLAARGALHGAPAVPRAPPRPRRGTAWRRFLPARLRRASRCTHRMVVRDRRARGRRPRWGFQITFFRAATAIAGADASRFAARQLLFAHGAVTDLAHADCATTSASPAAASASPRLRSPTPRSSLRDWRLDAQRQCRREPLRGTRASDSAGFALRPRARGDAAASAARRGRLSRKGPRPEQSSRYYSEPQLAVRGTLSIEGRRPRSTGRAWLDHEWSDAYMDPGAAGWDWIGMNLDDGSALMAFRMRRADGSTLWSGGSHRAPAARRATSPTARSSSRRGGPGPARRSSTRYPVEWHVATPVGGFGVRALLDDQELDSRMSTGAIYWEARAPRRRERPARRPRLPRDDRLRQAARPLIRRAQSRLTRRTRRFSAEPGSADVGQLRRATADRGDAFRRHAARREIALHFVGALLERALVVGGTLRRRRCGPRAGTCWPKLGRRQRCGEILEGLDALRLDLATSRSRSGWPSRCWAWRRAGSLRSAESRLDPVSAPLPIRRRKPASHRARR